MDMRGQPERRFSVRLRRDDGYRFRSQAREDGRLHGEPFVSDEPDPVGDASGPSTPALLAAALGHCLSAALIEVLGRSRIQVGDCETDAVAIVRPNEEGLPRIGRVEVTIKPAISDHSPRIQRCAEIFENYCTVTSSVKEGIDVRVGIDWSGPDEEEVRDTAAGVPHAAT